MSFTTLDNVFWVSGFAGHAVLVFVLLARSRWRSYPVFTGFASFQLVVTVLLFLVSQAGTHQAYFVSYWLCALGDFGFQIALLFEIANIVCRKNGVWIRTARTGLVSWALLGTLIAVGLCLTVRPPNVVGLDLWEMRSTLFTSLLTCGLVLAITRTTNRLRLQWRDHLMAVGQGLALWSAVAVLGDCINVSTGWQRDFVAFDRLRMLVYLGDLVFWIVVFWLPEKDRGISLDQVDYVAALQWQRPTPANE